MKRKGRGVEHSYQCCDDKRYANTPFLAGNCYLGIRQGKGESCGKQKRGGEEDKKGSCGVKQR